MNTELLTYNLDSSEIELSMQLGSLSSGEEYIFLDKGFKDSDNFSKRRREQIARKEGLTPEDVEPQEGCQTCELYKRCTCTSSEGSMTEDERRELDEFLKNGN